MEDTFPCAAEKEALSDFYFNCPPYIHRENTQRNIDVRRKRSKKDVHVVREAPLNLMAISYHQNLEILVAGPCQQALGWLLLYESKTR